MPTTPNDWRAISDAHAQPFLDTWGHFEPELFAAIGMSSVEHLTQELPPDLADRKIDADERLLALTRRALAHEEQGSSQVTARLC
jgi:hypothetical protein